MSEAQTTQAQLSRRYREGVAKRLHRIEEGIESLNIVLAVVLADRLASERSASTMTPGLKDHGDGTAR